MEDLSRQIESDDPKSRLRRMIGDEGLSKLENSKVVVFGLGGVGSSCAEALARGAVGNLVLIDKDQIEPSNINRQAIAFVSTIGKRKVDVMANMARDIDPEIGIERFDLFVNADNIGELMGRISDPDYIIDALDTLTVKTAIAKYAQAHDIPIVSAMGSANKTDPTKFEFAKLEDTKVCPLCREMRKIARDNGLFGLDVLYSSEAPIRSDALSRPDRRERTELGTLSFMPPIMGQMLAGFVILKLIGL